MGLAPRNETEPRAQSRPSGGSRGVCPQRWGSPHLWGVAGLSHPIPWHWWSPYKRDGGPSLALPILSPVPEGHGRSQLSDRSRLQAGSLSPGLLPGSAHQTVALQNLSPLKSAPQESIPKALRTPLLLRPRTTGHSLVHGEAHQASAEARGPLLLQGLAPQEGHGGLELAGEGQARLQGAVVRPQVCVPVPVACAEGHLAQGPSQTPTSRPAFAPRPGCQERAAGGAREFREQDTNSKTSLARLRSPSEGGCQGSQLGGCWGHGQWGP